MQAWLVALCAIRFDVERGQLLEASFPSDALTQSEESHIAFSAFPDSSPSPLQQQQQQQRIHDSQFFFRIPRRDESFLYGYVFNRQRHDEKLPRGGEQKSLVLLSHLPFCCVFMPLAQIAGPLFFDIGPPALHQIAAAVSRWPPPRPGSAMELPVIAKMLIRAALPPLHSLPPPLQPKIPKISHQIQDLSSTTGGKMLTISDPPRGIFPEIHIFGVLRGVLMQLWLLWEIALIGEPLLVVAPNPSISSRAVAAVCSLITPIPCSSDFRPYFTIHDPDLAPLLTSSADLPPIILGVTNPYFVRSLDRFPNVLSLQEFSPPKQQQQQQQPSQRNRINLLFLGKGRMQQREEQKLRSKHVPCVKPDVSVLNRLLLDDHQQPPSPRTDDSMDFMNSEILARHFVELTTNFLSPLAPYFRPAPPPLNPFSDPPPLPAFDLEKFLAALVERGPGKFLAKRLLSNWIDLYRRFLNGSNFLPWFQARRAAAEKEQRRMWRTARARVDVRSLVLNLPELHLVDTFHAIMRHVLGERQMNSSMADKLRGDLRVVFGVLPKDLQQLLLLNPQHAALLQVQSSSSTLSSSSSSSRESVKIPGRPSILISYMNDPSGLTASGRLIQELARDPLDLNKI